MYAEILCNVLFQVVNKEHYVYKVHLYFNVSSTKYNSFDNPMNNDFFITLNY